MASPREVPSYPSPRGQCWIVPYSVLRVLCCLCRPGFWSCLGQGGPQFILGRFHSYCFSAGCVLLYKQDFTKNLGLCCITCTYCSQTCQRAVTEQLEGSTWDFCSEDCKSKYLLWYFKVSIGTGSLC